MAPSRNFRTTYYKTLGVPVVQHIVDVEASYLALFTEPVVNTEQLMKLALEVGIAPSFRALAWKVLCGVLPAYKCLWEMAVRERGEMYDDLVAAAAVLELPCPEECRPAMTVEEAASEVAMTSPSQSAHKLCRLYHTYRKDVLRATPMWIFNTVSEHECNFDASELVRVVRVLEEVLPDNVADQFWCLVRIVNALEEAHSLLEPSLWRELLSDITVHSLETIFIRAVDCVKNGSRS